MTYITLESGDVIRKTVSPWEEPVEEPAEYDKEDTENLLPWW